MHFTTFLFHVSIKPLMHGWNHHSAHNKSPHQLFTARMLLLRHSRLIGLDFFDNVDSTYYGIDEDGPVPTGNDESGTNS